MNRLARIDPLQSCEIMRSKIKLDLFGQGLKIRQGFSFIAMHPVITSFLCLPSLFHLFMSGFFPAINVKAKLRPNCEDRSD